jgi:hypothetical protein
MRRTLIPLLLVTVLAGCGGKSEAEKEREAAAKSGRGTVTCSGSAMSGATGLPADFPKIDGITFVTSAKTGPTQTADGYANTPLKDLYEQYQSGMKDAGYTILFDEREEDRDAEISYEAKDKSSSGIVALRNCDADKTSVHITNRPG